MLTAVPTDAVHAIVPLSLLEAMRNLDTPIDDGLAELADEMVAKRLGLSQTVGVQIERFRQAADRGEEIPLDEVVSVFRLVSRRQDAQLVFADAGRRAARYAARLGSSLARRAIRASPGPIRRRLGLRSAAKAARGVLWGEMRPAGALAEVTLPDSLATRAGAEGVGCAYYGAAFAELLRMTSGFEGAMVHERCRARGDDTCAWRAATVEGYA
jgi:hypothetical protein